MKKQARKCLFLKTRTEKRKMGIFANKLSILSIVLTFFSISASPHPWVLMIVYAVDILLGGHRIAGMEVCGYPQSLIGGDLIGKMDIQGTREAIHGNGGLHVVLPAESDCSAEHEGMHPAIGTGTPRHVTGLAEESGDSLGKGLLDGVAVLLGLVTAEGTVGRASAVVADVEKYFAGLGFHGRPPFDLFRYKDSIA